MSNMGSAWDGLLLTLILSLVLASAAAFFLGRGFFVALFAATAGFAAYKALARPP
jgi:hypothetical protein